MTDMTDGGRTKPGSNLRDEDHTTVWATGQMGTTVACGEPYEEEGDIEDRNEEDINNN